ncbi:G-D-S-L family lipolytic protein [Salinimicrobium tongyeongense]|uniref:G-D-S-L family lipolytic protein n=1 Tax=Salinimicrobium tongyeongense TaxID=2809707 RepID=A0ABY6NTL7_9FLAO|nr:G-D-S-L family lipolytic protein [Salinimicrobium tongyeongense]UZH56257.1 G-D-S-L family lipolytic protein [Salinimicrobium tongyeongense]
MKNYIKYIGILALGMVACEPEFDNPVDEQDAYSNGEADFSNYVALGNSLTAGYADNALYITGQENSYPNILAQQFAKVQETQEFRIPFMADNAGGLLFGGQPNPNFRNRLVLSIIDGDTLPKVYTGMAPTTEVANSLSGYFNNMGIPGARSYHLLAPGYGNIEGLGADPTTANPYFVRFASTPGTTVVADAVAQNPTFFSLWIGNNDVLGYATSGGVDENEITSLVMFQGVYSTIVNSLLESGATGGVLINIPNVTDVPFFTYIPTSPLDPTNPQYGPNIPTLNQTFALLNPALLALRGVTEETPGESEFSIEFNPAGASPVIVRDESLPDISQQLKTVLQDNGYDEATATIYASQFGQVRQATSEDLIPLTSSSAIGALNQERFEELVEMGLPQSQAGLLATNGITYPLEDQYVLTPSEQEKISARTEEFNEHIKTVAEQNGLAHVDAAGLLSKVATEGISFDAGTVTSDFVRGGAFSLDGIHLTPRGYALVANKIIEEINKTYNSEVPTVNIGNYGTVTPNNQVGN